MKPSWAYQATASYFGVPAVKGILNWIYHARCPRLAACTLDLPHAFLRGSMLSGCAKDFKDGSHYLVIDRYSQRSVVATTYRAVVLRRVASLSLGRRGT